MPGTTLTEKEWKKCLQAVEDIPIAGFIIASGSLPPGVPNDMYAALAKIAKTKNARLVVDTSGEALKLAVEEGVYLLKPNLGELAFLAGKKEIQPNEVKSIAQAIIAQGRCEVMVVSMGAAGAMLVTAEIAETFIPPAVMRKSTVGAGDSMVAGIVYFLTQGKDLSLAVQYGVACGTAATLNAGTELCRKADADRLFALIRTSH